MKSYIQGLITGSVFTFSFVVLLSNQKPFSKTFKTNQKYSKTNKNNKTQKTKNNRIN